MSAGSGKGVGAPQSPQSGRACTLRSMASSSVRRFARFWSSKVFLIAACGRRRGGRCRARARRARAPRGCRRCTGVALGERFDAGCAHRSPPAQSGAAPPRRASPWPSFSWLPQQPATEQRARRRGSMIEGQCGGNGRRDGRCAAGGRLFASDLLLLPILLLLFGEQPFVLLLGLDERRQPRLKCGPYFLQVRQVVVQRILRHLSISLCQAQSDLSPAQQSGKSWRHTGCC